MSGLTGLQNAVSSNSVTVVNNLFLVIAIVLFKAAPCYTSQVELFEKLQVSVISFLT